ncbi:hypothetical protein PG984_000296 [Apiospora sp. TS-2023a]
MAEETIVHVILGMLVHRSITAVTKDPQRLTEVVKHFINQEWVKDTIVEETLARIWNTEDDGGQDKIIHAELLECREFKDLWDPTVENCLRYIRLHDYIAHLMAQGLVRSLTYYDSVVRKAFEEQQLNGPEGSSIRGAALAAAAKYRSHAEKELLTIAR